MDVDIIVPVREDEPGSSCRAGLIDSAAPSPRVWPEFERGRRAPGAGDPAQAAGEEDLA